MPVTNAAGPDSRSCDTNNTGATAAAATASNNPLHLFNSSAYYQQNSSSPPPSSSSAQSYSGLVPTTAYTSPLVASAHRNTKQSLQMSTESDTDPDNSPTARDILSDPSFLRAATSGGSSSASAALFQTLSGRVQHLMSRVGGGSSMNGRLQQYIQGIQVIPRVLVRNMTPLSLVVARSGRQIDHPQRTLLRKYRCALNDGHVLFVCFSCW